MQLQLMENEYFANGKIEKKKKSSSEHFKSYSLKILKSAIDVLVFNKDEAVSDLWMILFESDFLND